MEPCALPNTFIPPSDIPTTPRWEKIWPLSSVPNNLPWYCLAHSSHPKLSSCPMRTTITSMSVTEEPPMWVMTCHAIPDSNPSNAWISWNPSDKLPSTSLRHPHH
eukprot:scaffold274426_cov51-Attheya_sp.AAC.1